MIQYTDMIDMAALVKSVINKYGLTNDVKYRMLNRYGVVYTGLNRFTCVNGNSKWNGSTVIAVQKG